MRTRPATDGPLFPALAAFGRAFLAAGLALLAACGALTQHGQGGRATHLVVVKGNLDAAASVLDDAWDPAHPGTTTNFAFEISIFDSLGHSHTMSMYFRFDGNRVWRWHALTDGGGVTGGTAGTATEIASGILRFDTQGRLVNSSEQSSSYSPIDADQPQAIVFDFGDDTDTGGEGLGGTTQFAGPSATTFVSQDGAA